MYKHSIKTSISQIFDTNNITAIIVTIIACFATLIFFKAKKKYTLSNGTATLFLNVPLQRVHLSKPNKIIPDRWNTDHARDQPFLHTFQNGPHICPGKPLSLLEGRVFLLLIVMLFEFDFNEGTSKVEFEDSGLLRPKDGMLLIVKKRL